MTAEVSWSFPGSSGRLLGAVLAVLLAVHHEAAAPVVIDHTLGVAAIGGGQAVVLGPIVLPRVLLGEALGVLLGVLIPLGVLLGWILVPRIRSLGIARARAGLGRVGLAAAAAAADEDGQDNEQHDGPPGRDDSNDPGRLDGHAYTQLPGSAQKL